MQKKYEKLTDDLIREETFIYNSFTEGNKGRLIVSADDDKCWSKRFPINLTNRKEDLLPLDVIESRVRKFKL